MKNSFSGIIPARMFTTVGLSLTVSAAAFADLFPNLGAAANYAVLGAGNTSMTISSGNTRVNGNVGEGAGSSLAFSGGGQISGRLDVDPSSTFNISGGNSVAGGTSSISMAQASADLVSASAYAAGLTPGQTLSSISNSTGTINRLGTLSVFSVTNGINLSGGSALTLNGTASDYFVFNVSGALTLSGGSAITLTGGLTAENVLFNFVGTGQDINFNGNSTANGNFLALDRNITVSGGVINGRLLGADGKNLKLQSGPTVNAPVPEPASLAALGVGAAALLKRRKKK